MEEPMAVTWVLREHIHSEKLGKKAVFFFNVYSLSIFETLISCFHQIFRLLGYDLKFLILNFCVNQLFLTN